MIVLLLALLIVVALSALGADPKNIGTLYESKQWEQVLAATESAQPASADGLYFRGMALVHLGRHAEAAEVFRKGRDAASRDSRFPVELAGLAYLDKDRTAAKRYLHEARDLSPDDAYVNEFLATLYLLDGNVEAALRYWNKVGKPQVRDVRIDDSVQTDHALIRRALAFSDRGTLWRSEWERSISNLERLQLFSAWRLELLPTDSAEFEVSLRAIGARTESRGIMRVLPFLRGLPYQAIHYDSKGVGGSHYSLTSMWRWDAQKRRVYALISGPLRGDPRTSFRLFLDGRRENWDVSRTYRGGPTSGDFAMDKVEGGAALDIGITGRLVWSSGASISYREFGGLLPRADTLFDGGAVLQQHSSLTYQLLRSAEKRFMVETRVRESIGRNFAASSFAKLEGETAATWLPGASGRKLTLESRFRAGALFGTVPFDELYILGMERDNDLWLRGHVGTRDGKKGSAPLARSYQLWQNDARRTVFTHPLFQVQVGPFLDAGRAGDRDGAFGADRWLVDSGLEARVRLLGGVQVVLTYGRDLRGGRNAFYGNVIR